MQLRAEMERMVVADLLGPAGGDSEELDERNVRDRYLVGVLAPKKHHGVVSAPSTTDGPVEVEDDDDTPLIPDELSEGGTDTADDVLRKQRGQVDSG